MTSKTLVTGFPRIGEKRELKRALENYWAGKITIEGLQQTARELRKRHWSLQKEKGIDLISSNDFSFYDSMLDTIVMLNAIPERFSTIENKTELYFAMARGSEHAAAMEMTKWFNTNYHYIVPELDGSTQFRLDDSKIISEYQEAATLGIKTKINLIGPITFLGLSKTVDGSSPYMYHDKVLSVYKELMTRLATLDHTVYVQIEEPVFVKDPTDLELDLLNATYQELSTVSDNLRIIVTTYFEHSKEATKILVGTPVWAIGLDFVNGARNIDSVPYLKNKTLIAGVIDGRNIWRGEIEASLRLLENLSSTLGKERIVVSTSCSLLHTPFSLDNEPDSPVKRWLSFCREKVDELATLGELFHASERSETQKRIIEDNRKLHEEKSSSTIISDNSVKERLKTLNAREREGTFKERIPLQEQILKLPFLPTTTIGSFPQTPELRKKRRDFKKGELSSEQYEAYIKGYIDDCITFQEEVGLDVLVHGEPERNDMVEYFGEMLNGFHFTEMGWVQSYGSRCVKPPIIYGDVSRPNPMTVKWITYAQSKTEKTVKGMLTGPVTILNWSFVRNDVPRAEVSKQIAVALRDEINDLQMAGIKIIQVDEAAFKEGYPLRKENIPEYEKWAVESFKLAVSKAEMKTQIHTHMCYSEFNDIIETIESMDADVITIETARSGNELLNIFREVGYKNEIGPGVYDIHSPVVPSVEEFSTEIDLRLEVIPVEKMWINPDCGLKTRKWEEVKPALKHMVEAGKRTRLS